VKERRGKNREVLFLRQSLALLPSLSKKKPVGGRVPWGTERKKEKLNVGILRRKKRRGERKKVVLGAYPVQKGKRTARGKRKAVPIQKSSRGGALGGTSVLSEKRKKDSVEKEGPSSQPTKRRRGGDRGKKRGK